MVCVVSSMIISGISGSSVADAASIGSVLIPEMERRGYSREYAAGITVAAVAPDDAMQAALDDARLPAARPDHGDDLLDEPPPGRGRRLDLRVGAGARILRGDGSRPTREEGGEGDEERTGARHGRIVAACTLLGDNQR